MVQLEKRIRTTVRVNNNGDANRVYNISAEVEYIHEKQVFNIHSAAVTLDKSALAEFAKFGEDLNVQYIGLNKEQQIKVLSTINDFIAETGTAIMNGEIINL